MSPRYPPRASPLPARIAAIGLAALMSGISLASMFYGALTVPYYAAALSGLALCVPFVLQRMTDRLPAIIVIGSLPVVLTALQYWFLDIYAFIPPSFLASIGTGAVLFAAAVAGNLPLDEFRRAMAYAAIAHAGICAYGILFWDFSAVTYGGPNRLGTEEMGTAVWGELAAGAAIAALLSGRRWLLFAVVPVAAMVIYGTQMRGAGLAIFTALFLYWFLTAGRKIDPLLLLAGLCVLLAAGLALMGEISRFVGAALLLDDPHRGLDSGLSGRLENWALAWERFVHSPLIGVGQSDRIAANAHNGILKIFAEYGVALALPMLAFVAVGARNAWNARRFDIFAAIAALLVFIGPAPRYINFQIMPFVGIAAVAFALCSLGHGAVRRPGLLPATGRSLGH